MTLPSLFLSHGSPGLILEDCPARDFLAGLAGLLPRPKAILVASAHWETARPTVAATARPETIHDFFGFPRPLYDIRYAAPGAPALAERVGNLLLRAGFDPALDPSRGLDHGAWALLHLAWPKAEIPTLQLSIQSDLPAEHHLRLGAALKSLRDEGVLIVGSGSATHNLLAFRRSRLVLDSPVAPWAAAFADWLAGRVAAGDRAALLDWEAAPGARENHPSPEHFLPFFVALGAGTPALAGRALHRSWTYGVLAMDAYAFD
jgi:4,5-DOPA dioxygenase extradiol